jgi:hypothetical protein
MSFWNKETLAPGRWQQVALIRVVLHHITRRDTVQILIVACAVSKRSFLRTAHAQRQFLVLSKIRI